MEVCLWFLDLPNDFDKLTYKMVNNICKELLCISSERVYTSDISSLMILQTTFCGQTYSYNGFTQGN